MPLIIFDPQQRSNFFGVGESLRFYGRIGQKHGDQKPNDYGQSSNSNVEDPPIRKSRVGKADPVGDKATKDLGKRVTDIEPRYTSPLLFLFIPHGDDEYQNRGHARFNVSRSYGHAR